MPPVRILIVDDDPAVNFLCCEIFQGIGFEVVAVYCAAAAFQALDSDAELSALVTDIELGAGPDGFAVARRARNVDPTLPVVYVSGTAAARHRSEGVERSEFVQKPFGPPEIVEALSRVCHRETGSIETPADAPTPLQALAKMGPFLRQTQETDLHQQPEHKGDTFAQNAVGRRRGSCTSN